ncbi:hypothetical protein [uncultured Phycicoccus sp.]|uniref:hypothetical protein n=1 Tax=uncultured Phycicoccus sp. TaxID=661422 RepID=UPI0026294709|nr:hypothetical protein [uncultured Phycicoccus sp.]
MPAPTLAVLAQRAHLSNPRVAALVAGSASLALLLTAAPTSAAGSAAAAPPAGSAGQPLRSLSAGAGNEREVDPLSLTPALNPTFTWSCARTGAGITCHGERRTSYGPEPVGFDCDGLEVYVTGRGEDTSTRWHTAEGLATRTITQRSFPEDRMTLAPDTSGPAVVSRQHWTQHYRYGTPGDVTTRVLVETGQVLMVHGTGAEGKVFQLTGRTEFAPGMDFESVVQSSGRDDFAAGRDFVAEVCRALT